MMSETGNETSSDNAGSTVEKSTSNLHNKTKTQQSDIIGNTEGSSVNQISAEVDEPSGSETCEEAMEAAKETSDEGVDSYMIAKEIADAFSLLINFYSDLQKNNLDSNLKFKKAVEFKSALKFFIGLKKNNLSSKPHYNEQTRSVSEPAGAGGEKVPDLTYRNNL